MRGMGWSSKGEYDKGIADINRAIKLNPKGSYGYIWRGNIWMRKGVYDKSLADINRAIALDPKCAEAYRLRGRTQFDNGKFAIAAKDFSRYLTINPNDKFVALWRYMARRRIGQPAVKELDAFAAKYVKNRSAWLGPVFELFAGRIDAAKCLKAAEPKKGDLSKLAYAKLRRNQLCEAYFYVAQYELIAGRTDKARELLKKCMATKAISFVEYTSAKAELKRMEAKAK